MSGPNVDWAIAELDKFIQQTMMRNGSSSSGGAVFLTSADYTASPDGEVIKQAPVVEQLPQRVIPRWRTDVPKDSANNRWAQHREAALRAREVLIRDREVRGNLCDDAPEISAARLHTWTWSGASSLWSLGHYREAVGSAARKLNAETQTQVDRRDVSETDLFKQVFSLDAARPGKARLRRMPPDDSDTYTSVQRGAMAPADANIAGIRNSLSHEADVDLYEQTALEYLAALSVLARWVDDAEVERVEEMA